MTTRSQRILTTLATIAVVLAVAWAHQEGYLGTPRPGEDGPTRDAPHSRGRYDPAGPAPLQALPGGSLAAHEGRGHTLERHVGRTDEQLRERLQAEQKREVSTFPDLGTAEHAVARALFERRREVSEWLAQGALGDTAITWRGPDVVGRVLRAGERQPQPGHTTHVVLAGSQRFPEGFAVRTAYVRLP
jgi:hypothetical protein